MVLHSSAAAALLLLLLFTGVAFTPPPPHTHTNARARALDFDFDFGSPTDSSGSSTNNDSHNHCHTFKSNRSGPKVGFGRPAPAQPRNSESSRRRPGVFQCVGANTRPLPNGKQSLLPMQPRWLNTSSVHSAFFQPVVCQKKNRNQIRKRNRRKARSSRERKMFGEQFLVSWVLVYCFISPFERQQSVVRLQKVSSKREQH